MTKKTNKKLYRYHFLRQTRCFSLVKNCNVFYWKPQAIKLSSLFLQDQRKREEGHGWSREKEKQCNKLEDEKQQSKLVFLCVCWWAKSFVCFKSKQIDCRQTVAELYPFLNRFFLLPFNSFYGNLRNGFVNILTFSYACVNHIVIKRHRYP